MPSDVIRKKRDGHALSQTEVEAFVKAATHNHWPEYQLSALLMAIVLRGMSPEETSWLTAGCCDVSVGHGSGAVLRILLS